MRRPASADPLWYKDAVIYEVNVRAFADSDADGVGDFKGLTSRLDYLRDLGVTALWLLPFYPSPLRDDGYDIADYLSVAKAYGSLEDFKTFLSQAHARGLRVITELVLNHTSDQHPWFQRARRAPAGSPERDFYVWSDTPERWREARIIFKDFETSNWTWDPVAKAYFWHRFYSHQPDLNFRSPQVRAEMLAVVDFWLGLGVDGLRLDAVPYLFEREGTNCENLPETHAYLKELRAHVDARHEGRMLLAEANQWPEDAVAYFGGGLGDECHTAFHFPVMPRLFMALHTEDRFPITDILEQTPSPPELGQWVLFLRNHDELTLEMVTDEERDYMYRVFASDPQARINLGIRRRLAPLLSNHRRRIELMNGLLFSLPGTPVVYYGDEIGMGDNFYLGDRNGVRTPMQWSSDRNAGFSRATPQRLYLPVIIDPEYHYEAVNVDVQQNNPQSLLWWMKRVIAFRRRFKAFGRGALRMLSPVNRKILAFVRSHGEEHILVVANLSRFVQYAELPLKEYAGRVPEELIGRSRFPAVTDAPYPITMGPHEFYWFALKAPAAGGEAAEPPPAAPAESELWDPDVRPALEEACLRYARRVEAGVGGAPPETSSVPLGPVPLSARCGLALLHAEAAGAELRPFVVRVSRAEGDEARDLRRTHGTSVIADAGEGRPLLFDAALDPSFGRTLLGLAAGSRDGDGSGLAAPGSPRLRELAAAAEAQVSGTVFADGQAIITFGTSLALRLFWRLEPGLSPAVELGRFLTERAAFKNAVATLGALELRRPSGPPATLGVFMEPQPSTFAWQHALDCLGRFFECALSNAPGARPAGPPTGTALVELAARPLPAAAFEMVGPFLADAELLGRRMGELHLALASFPDDPAFAPEPFSALYQRSLYQSMRTLTREVGHLLRRRLPELPETERAEAQRVLELEEETLRRLRSIHSRPIHALRLRCHGDLHLGRVLHTGKDFLFTGFEGDAQRPLSERRIKRSPLRDVASMIRSFHYAVHTSLFGRQKGSTVRPQDRPALVECAAAWQTWVGASLLRGYLEAAGRASFLPSDPKDLRLLLDTYLREKAVLELGRELQAGRGRVSVPLKGLAALLESVSGAD